MSKFLARNRRPISALVFFICFDHRFLDRQSVRFSQSNDLHRGLRLAPVAHHPGLRAGLCHCIRRDRSLVSCGDRPDGLGVCVVGPGRLRTVARSGLCLGHWRPDGDAQRLARQSPAPVVPGVDLGHGLLVAWRDQHRHPGQRHSHDRAARHPLLQSLRRRNRWLPRADVVGAGLLSAQPGAVQLPPLWRPRLLCGRQS